MSYSIYLCDISDTDLYIKNTSLEIRSARREDHGLYQCSASNLEGKTDSNELALDIHCKSHYRSTQTYHDLCREKERLISRIV